LVLTAHTPEALKALIRFVSVTSSKIGSQSSGVGIGKSAAQAGEEIKEAEFADQVQEFKAENQNLDALTDGF
jgi:hypothetical protein